MPSASTHVKRACARPVSRRAVLAMAVVAAILHAQPRSGVAMGGGADRILFVGRAFDLGPGIQRHTGNLAAASYRFDTAPISVEFYSETPPDTDRITQALARFAPVVVVVSAFQEGSRRPGLDRSMQDNLALIIEHARQRGAQVFLLAHPPAKPDRPLGYPAAVRRIETLTGQVAEQTGATLVRTGAFFEMFPDDERQTLYRAVGTVPSDAGEQAIALTIAMALGVDVRALQYYGAADPPLPRWIGLAERWAVESGLRPAPLLPTQ